MARCVWEKWRIILPFSLAVLSFFLTQQCQAATHWIVTENGRIEAQANSLFNLQKPFDLVMFIQQEQKLNKVNNLRDELKKEQDILEEVNRQEQIDLSETFFKTDPTCSKLKRWYELELSLNFIIPFSNKGINVGHHIDLESAVKTHSVKTPLCLRNIPITLYSYDHLEGVANRHTLPGINEYGLLATMKYIKDVDDWGDRIARALTKNSTSWVLQNMAALYWRIKGNTVQSINCLREALFYSPREHRDIALFGLALVLHRANYSMDAIMLLHASLDITREVALHQYILGNIYATLDLFNMTELCLKYVALVQPAFQPAVKRLKVAVCERRYQDALQDQFSSLEKVLSKVDKHNDKKKTLQKLQDRDDIKQQFAYDVFKRQLERLSKEPVAWTESPLLDHQEIVQNGHVKGQEITNIQKEIVSAIGNNNNVDNGDAFTVNIQLEKGGPVVQKKVYCQKADANGETTQVPCKMFEVEGKQGEKSTKLEIEDKYVEEIFANEKKEKAKAKDKMTNRNEKKREGKKLHSNIIMIKETDEALKSEKKGNEKKEGEKEKMENIPTNEKIKEKDSITEEEPPNKKIPDSKEKSPRTVETSAPKSKKSKKKHETGKRATKSTKKLEEESLTLHERTVRQMEHARATIARVRSMLNIPHASKDQSIPFRGAKNTAGPGGTGQEVFLKDDFKSTKKGETVRSASDDPTFDRRQVPPIKHYAPDDYRGTKPGQQKQFCKNPSGSKKRKGDTLGRGCQLPANNVPQKEKDNLPDKEGTVTESKEKSGNDANQVGSQATKPDKTDTQSRENTVHQKDQVGSQAKKDGSKATVSNSGKSPTDNKKSKSGSKKTQIERKNKTNKKNSGKEGVLSSLKEFQEALKKSKTQPPGHDFDYRNCDKIDDPVSALSHKNTMVTTVVSVASKGVEVSAYIDFDEDISGLPKPPRCSAKIIPGSSSLSHIKGILQVGKNVGEPESSLRQTLLSHAHMVGKNMDVDEIGTRIHRALKKHSTCYVALNLAALYWRIMGDVHEAVRCLRLAVQHAPTRSVQDIPLISLASILFRGGFLEDSATLGREALEITPNAAIGHFALANTLAAQGSITEATQHFLIVLQLEPGFLPAIERLKVIQCILWNQQKELEKEADQLRKLLAAT